MVITIFRTLHDWFAELGEWLLQERLVKTKVSLLVDERGNMITTAEAFAAFEQLAKALRNPPQKPQEKRCEYCARPIEKCGCGASK